MTVDPGPLDGVPLLVQPAEAGLPGKSQEARPPQAMPRLHGRVLLVEDGPDNQRLIAFVLRKAGAEVALAENGQGAVSAVLAALPAGPERPFDVILMDMQMPVLDGYAATRQLRSMGYRGPIVALTAHAMTQDRQKCLEAGCNDYLPKPIDRRKLLETVEQYMRPPTPQDCPQPAAPGM